MATTITPDTHDSGEHEHHPSDLTYIGVAVFLAVVTGLEVLTYFIDFGVLAVPLLIILMVIKFAFVVAWFMHLRFDNRLFAWLFTAGLLLALTVYIALLVIFRVWWDPEPVQTTVDAALALVG